uniref:Uncharacterized protein n=1 Tax=Oryza rufipogon TaxID=4529 RepID=A0A0E0RD55_ORYRU
MVGCGWARKNVTWSASPRWSKACLIWGWNTKKHIAAVQSYSLCFTMFTRQKQRILQVGDLLRRRLVEQPLLDR